jgi:hypothetical protein
MREVNGRGSNDGGGNLLGQIQLLLRWQLRRQPVGGEYTIPISVLTVVDEGDRQWRQRRRWRLAADNSVDGGGWRQRGASSPVVIGSGEAIVGGQWTMAG